MGIGESAFYNCSSITSFTISDSVTSIEPRAFMRCANLTSVEIPAGVISIGNVSFAECYSLTSVMIPDSVINFGNEAFVGCYSLTNATINCVFIGYRAFGDCANLSSVTIGPHVNGIKLSAFESCSSLTTMTIPDNVTSIEGLAFEMSGLTNIVIGGGVTNIGVLGFGAFLNCSSLIDISVSISNSFYSSLNGVMFNKDQTVLLQYPGGKSGAYSIPDSVSIIGREAFMMCRGITCVTVPSGVTSIDADAFGYCSDLAGVYFRGNAPSIGANIFRSSTPTIFYLAGTVDWPLVPGLWAERPTAEWLPVVQADDSFGVKAGFFGFSVYWSVGQTGLVEACTNLANPVWVPVGANTFAGCCYYFSDNQWTNYPGRFYRIRPWP